MTIETTGPRPTWTAAQSEHPGDGSGGGWRTNEGIAALKERKLKMRDIDVNIEPVPELPITITVGDRANEHISFQLSEAEGLALAERLKEKLLQ